MTEPRTEAGRALLDDIGHLSPKGTWSENQHEWERTKRAEYAAHIKRIEAGAAKPWREVVAFVANFDGCSDGHHAYVARQARALLDEGKSGEPQD